MLPKAGHKVILDDKAKGMTPILRMDAEQSGDTATVAAGAKR